MGKKVYITGMCFCKEALRSIETIRPVKTVIKAEELALSAAVVALKQAGLTPEGDSTGIIFGIDNAIDECKAQFYKGLLHDGPLGISPLLFPFTSHNAITAQVSIAFGIRGESATITSGSFSFLKAMEYGLELLNKGVIQSALIGGVSEQQAMVIVLETLANQEILQKKECVQEPFSHKDLSAIINAGKSVTSIEASFALMRNELENRFANV